MGNKNKKFFVRLTRGALLALLPFFAFFVTIHSGVPSSTSFKASSFYQLNFSLTQPALAAEGECGPEGCGGCILGVGCGCIGDCGSPEPGGGGGCGGTTIGDIICDMDVSWQYVPGLLSGISYLLGLFLGIMAIIKLREHVEDPRSVKLSESMMRFAAGGAFLALPEVLSVVVGTLDPDGIWFDETGFNSSGTTGDGLDAMVVYLMADIWGPISWLIAGFGYLAGIIFVMIGISRLVRMQQEGPRGPGGLGTIATFLTGGALMSIDSMMGGWSSSLFTTGTVSTYASLAFTSGMDPTEVQHVNAVISGVEAFLMVLGWISFVRGFFIVRGVAEGDQQASLMAGLTHLFGGALAVNIGPVMNAVQATLGLQDYGVNFT